MPLGSAWSNGAAGVHSCGILRRLEWRWGELRLRSILRYRLVCICFPTPGRGLPYGSGLRLSRCLGPGKCLHSFIHYSFNNKRLLTLKSMPHLWYLVFYVGCNYAIYLSIYVFISVFIYLPPTHRPHPGTYFPPPTWPALFLGGAPPPGAKPLASST